MVVRDQVERSFGLEDLNSWVKRCLVLETGGRCILKLVFHESFDMEMGSVLVRYYSNYQVVATNSKAPGEEVWRVYNRRACCENFIKESIYGFGLDKSITRHWAGGRLYF